MEKETQQEEQKPKNMVEEARQLNEEIKQNLENLRKEREKIELLNAEAQLAGTAGAPPKKEVTEETPKDFVKRMGYV